MSQKHVTILLVTHSIETALEFAQRGIVLSQGKLKFDGNIKEATDFYYKTLATQKKKKRQTILEIN